jgi:hypothetical protein
MSHFIPDLDFAEKLAEQGYWIFPCYNRQKGARQVMGRPWSWHLEHSNPETLAATLSGTDATGSCICPNPTDEIPLLILDFDLDPNEKWTHEKLWERISAGLPIPEGLGVSKSISGGFHIWFRLPEGSKLPDKFDLGSGLSGEIRASNRPKTFLMLPGSIALNKEGKVKKYSVDLPIHLDKLPEPPPSLLARLASRPNQSTKEEVDSDGIPTEISHLLQILEFTSFPEGDRNQKISQLGQIMGRVIPASKLSLNILEQAWKVVAPKLGRGFDQKEFLKAMNSGFKTGRANANKFNKREKNPTATDVESESETVFGGRLWMKKLIDSTAKTVGFIIGVGGSEKRPDEAEISIQLELFNIDEMLPYLAQAAKVDPDVVVTSPLFVQPGWKRVLEFTLKRRSTIEPLGLPPEDIFLEKLNSWARSSASDQRLIERWSEKRTFDLSMPFFVHPPDGEDVAFVLPERAYERLLRQLGDIAQARRLAKRFLLKKNLIGRANGWTIGLDQLDSGTISNLRMAYEKRIQLRIDEKRKTNTT